MFLALAHTKLDVYKTSRDLIIECYRITRLFPADEKFNMVQQIRRAALSVHLNIAEGCSRRSGVERIRFFEISRGSLIEVDTAMEIAYKLMYVKTDQLELIGGIIVKTFKLLSGMISKASAHN